jgi:hypothetical protein
VLLVLSALYRAGDAFFSPAVTGPLPETVQPARIQHANALLSLTRSSFWLAGPAVAGALVATAGPGWAFVGDATTFAISAASLARIRLPSTPRADRTHFVSELRAGWREVTGRTWVWASIVYFSIWNLAIGPLFVLGPVVCQRSLEGASSWGAIVTSVGVGSLVGAASCCLGVCALEPALLAKPFPTAVVAASAALSFGASAFSNALWFRALQERIPSASISHVSAYDWMGSIVFGPAGYALVGPVVAAAGTRSTLLASAAAIAAASVVASSLGSVRAVVWAGDGRKTGDGLSPS